MAHVSRVAARPQTPVAVCIGEPIAAAGSRDEMTQRVRTEVQALVHRARAGL